MSYAGLVVVPPTEPGRGQRRPLATRCVGNRPIACHAIDALRSAGIDDLAVVAPPTELEQVEQCLRTTTGERVTFVEQERRADLLGALSSAAGFIDGRPALVHLADGLLGQDLDRVVAERQGEDMPDLLLLLHRSEPSRGGLPAGTQRLLGLSELNGPGDRLALTGVWAFGPGALARAARAPDHPDQVNLMVIAEDLAAQGRVLEAEVVRGWRRYTGDPDDLLELNRIVLDHQSVPHEVIDRGDNRIEGRAVIHPTAELRSSIILGPCVIGPGARIDSSYIGPYTSIGANAVVEGAEIVRSIVAEDSVIRHVGTRIEGSTIGRGARIHRDFGLPRAMRLHVGRNVEVALS